MAEAPLRLLVVDDHGVFREGLVALLAAFPDVEVVGQAADGLSAVEEAARLEPALILMDLHMPVLDGVEATRRIVAARPDAHVLVLTMLEDDASVFAALEAGARGYLLKESGRGELERAIHAVAEGQAVLHRDVAPRVLAAATAAPRRDTPDPGAFPFLTDRERQVLDLVARGLTNPAIASRLYVSEKTVRNHVSNLFAKLHVTSRAQAVARARDAGYGDGPTRP